MRILGVGADLCDIRRLERELTAPQRGFVDAVFTGTEIAVCRADRSPSRRFAEHFAAKEAVLKALAFADGRGTFWREVEIVHDGNGKAEARLRGRLGMLAEDHAAGRIHLSLAAAGHHALAVAMIEERGGPAPRPDTNHTGD
ncbi:MAG: holo-ACP synthase [Candidatus Latescibacteria bacterium]|nr:holo-ACP synthase [Candidatus Latescibacterota bacterium]